MEIDVSVWRLADDLKQGPLSSMDRKPRLEDTLARKVSILSLALMLVGGETSTANGKFNDILGIEAGEEPQCQ